MPTGKPTKLKPCSICGELFLPEKPSSKICSKNHYSNCPICNKKILWNTTRKVEPCSKECRRKRTKLNNLEKYGVEHPMQNDNVKKNFKNSMMKKYGVEHALQSKEIMNKFEQTCMDKFGEKSPLANNEIYEKRGKTMIEKYGAEYTLQSEKLKEKVMNTNIKKYGVQNVMKNESIQNKAKKTNIIKYGFDNPMKNKEIINKVQESRSLKRNEILENIKRTMMERYNIENPMERQEFIDKIAETMMKRYGVKSAPQFPEFREKMIKTCMERYNAPYYIMSKEYFDTHPFNRISNINKKFGKLLEENNIDFEYEYNVGLKSYDFKIQNSNILIEIDPTYTHNSFCNHWKEEGIDKNYHDEKSQLAVDNGFRCIHVFDWDNWDDIINLIKKKNKIYARDCEIYVLKKEIGEKFINENHIQKSCRGQLIFFGLVKDGEIYQVMSFGKSRYDKQHSVELLRFCNKVGYSVIGGASKLFKFATDNYGINDIVSYCDASKFHGEVYEKMGMNLIRKTKPQKIWSNGIRKITSNLLRQRGYDQLFKTNYGKDKSNEQLMIENGWLPVYDCGQYVFEYK